MGFLDELIGTSETILTLRAQASRLLARQGSAGSRLPPILILGETGSGKGLLVRALHQASRRRERPLIEVNCAAIPETLVEAELFGFERGAFTDARQAKPGLFQAAHGGVLFLDEIGTLPPSAQAKLLTALDQRQVRRLGGTRTEAVDAWVLSATNEDLPSAMAQGRFRIDLYHRISPVTLRLPPLRERGKDVLALAEHFLARACTDYGLAARRLTDEAQQALLAHAWPGNVRELANLMERVALLSEGTDIAPEGLELPVPSATRREWRGAASLKAEREAVLEALADTQWNLSRAAARLGVPRNTLRYRIDRLGIRPADSRLPTAANREATAPAAPTASTPEPGLRWERRRVTALRVSLAVAADGGAFEATPMLERLVQKVESFGAMLDELRPLGFTVLFGLEPMEDAPSRAAVAAQAVLNTVGRAQGSGALTGRSAVHVQECLIGRGATVPGMHADERRQMGDMLDALARAAPAGATVVSAEAARFVDRAFELDPVRTSGAIVGYRVGERRRTGFEVAGRARSPLVGRNRELAQLDDLLTQAESGRGQVVGLVGEPGVGKSRLVYEFRRGIGHERVSYLEGRCVAYGSATPYLPIAALVREAFGFTDTDAPGVIGDRLRQGVASLGLDPDAVVPYVLHLLGVKDDTATGHALSPEAVRHRTMEALRQVAVAGSERRPTILAVEDLHWIDPTSEASLSILAESVAARRVLMLVTYRPGYQPPWLGKSYATQLVLRRLGPVDSRSIVEAAAPASGTVSTGLADAIVARANGVPFFLEELARSVPAEVDPRAAMAIPETIHDAVEARVDRLPAAERELLQVAAVLGQEGSASLLLETAGVPEEAFARSWTYLRTAELLHDSGAAASPHYAFAHVLIQEVVYRGLTLDRRRALHGAAAATIERWTPEAAARRPDVLALHYTEAGQPVAAIPCWLRAGQQAIQRSANVEAIAHLARGLALVAQLPDGRVRTQQELMLQLARSTALSAHHGYASDEVGQALGRVRGLAEALGEIPELMPVRFGLWRFYISRAELGAAAQFAASLLGTAEREKDDALLVTAHVASGLTKFYRGELGSARAHLERAVSLQKPAYVRAQALAYGQDLGVGAAGYLGWVLTLAGRPDTGLETAQRSLTVAREGGHPFTVALALLTAALVSADRREPSSTSLYGEELLSLSREQGFGFFTSLALGLAGWADFADGRRTQGLDRMRQGVDLYRAAGQRVGLRNRVQLAEALLEDGRIDEGLESIEADLAHVLATGEGALASEVYRIKGEVLSRRTPGNPQAETLIEHGLSIALAQSAELLALRAASSLVRLQRQSRRPAPALGALGELLSRRREGLLLSDFRAARALLDNAQGG